jgi:hypothetical protein
MEATDLIEPERAEEEAAGLQMDNLEIFVVEDDGRPKWGWKLSSDGKRSDPNSSPSAWRTGSWAVRSVATLGTFCSKAASDPVHLKCNSTPTFEWITLLFGVGAFEKGEI